MDSGPYAIIRHPGYAAASLVFLGMALSAGLPWALIPPGVAVLLIVIRTEWEDRPLQAELAGYSAYAKRVRYSRRVVAIRSYPVRAVVRGDSSNEHTLHSD
jgi:protein-S-isoprenylcysteine O-methyltransferase Ste14